MSYSKIALEISGLSEGLVVPDGADVDALLAAGNAVQLETGDRVWVSCVAADNPETYRIEFATVAIAVDALGAIRRLPSGQPVAVAFMHPVVPDVVAGVGPDAIRKDLMLVALGEPPLLDGIAPPSAERSIRSLITVAEQLFATPTDVL